MGMRNLFALTSITIGLFCPVLLTPPASAVGETCNGLAATLVGTHGSTVTGTDGPDVIVTNGAAHVDAGGGDDVICTTGTVAADPFNPAVSVLAGAGNDLVDRRGELSSMAVGFVGLGAGTNTLYGAAARDLVSSDAGSSDAISTGDGSDSVQLAYATTLATDVDTVDLGVGDDVASVNQGFAPGLSVAGGPGRDTLALQESPAAGWTLDAAAGQVRAGSTVYMTFSDFDDYSSYGQDPVSFIGSDRGESLFAFSSGLHSAAMGGGDDNLRLAFRPSKEGLALDGGAGRDLVEINGASGDRFDLDLAGRRLRSDGGPRGKVVGFEDATATGGHIVLTGTNGPNELVWSGCRGGRVLAGGGADTVSMEVVDPDYPCNARFTQPRLRAFGQGGPDVLVGGPAGDQLIGGPGRDKAIGGRGKDLCQAEKQKSCER
jgi:RTX calcium-binding nonapeptide repeat (4 copies)